MKKYKYNSELECFERFNKKGNPTGKKLWVNIVEARKIITLYNLGNTVGLIQSKMQFSSNKASGKTVETIVRLYENDDIELEGDFPAPSKDFEALEVDSKIDNLEIRVENLENIISELKSDCFCTAYAGESKTGIIDRIRTWI